MIAAISVRRRVTASLLCALALALTGCVTHGLINAPPQLVDPQETAEIVVARADRLTGSGVTWPVTLNGVEIYGLRVGEHVVMRVNPGDQIIGTRYYGVAFTWEDVTVSVKAEPRRTYYFRIDPGFGAPIVNAVTPETGRALMSTTTRISP